MCDLGRSITPPQLASLDVTALLSAHARVIFVHVQKTGGQSIDQILRDALPDAHQPGNASLRHPRLQQILNKHPEARTYWIFGFVRNPWDRLLSWHSRILQRTEAEREAHKPWRVVQDEYPQFEKFVLRGLDDDRLSYLRQPQVSYLRTRTRVADYVGRQEAFDTDVRAVCARLRIDPPAELPHVNDSDHRRPAYRDVYTPAARDRVAQVFAPDVAAFGYEY